MKWIHPFRLTVTGIMFSLPFLATASFAQENTAEEKEFVRAYAEYAKSFQPLATESAKAWWEASTTGSDEAFAKRTKAKQAIIKLNGNAKLFAKINSLRKTGKVRQPILKRQLDVMYNTLLPAQANPEVQNRIAELESQVDKIFNTHRGMIDEKPASENEIREILSTTPDSVLAEKAWKGYMEVGSRIEGQLRELVGLRNKMARELGFKNFFSMKMAIQEIDETELIELFDELDVLTKKPFDHLKKDIDSRMAKRFSISVDELRPWHFGDLFFQEAPNVEGVDLDAIFKDENLIALTKKYYESLGMPVDAIIARSDLYERDGKTPHAFCSHLDREGDVRVLCNLKPNAYWMDTLVHEIGHAVYDTYIDRKLPFLLREPSHSITTEGIAMMFGAMVKNEEWLLDVMNLSPEKVQKTVEAVRRTLRTEKTIFSRWTQVMVRFEQSMYANPDQDLGKLWWDLKKKYQSLNPPKSVSRPDFAAKMHIVGAPVYYHSYMMGDLFGSQVHYFVATSVLQHPEPAKTCFYGNKKAGDYFRKQIFEPGNLYSWSELTKRATGEPLSARYYAKLYIE